MCAPIPKNKWSWKASRCKGCGTRSKKGKHKHKGNGLCLSCFDKKRAENPNCLIISPIKPKELKNEIEKLKRFKEIVIRNCKDNLELKYKDS